MHWYAREGALPVQLRRISDGDSDLLHRGRVSQVLRGRIRLRRAVVIILSRRRWGSAAVMLGGICRCRRRNAVGVLVERGDGRVRAVTVVRLHRARAIARAGAKVMRVQARRERVLQHDRRTPEGARVDHRLALAVFALSTPAAQEKGDDEAGDSEADKAADDGNSDRGCTD